jgi:hypothetical protein
MFVLAAHPDDATTSAAAAALAGMGLVGVLFILGSLILGLVVNWLIVSKAGYSGALSLLAFVPVVNFVVILMFAFSKWPIQREIELLRANRSWPGTPPPDPYRQADATNVPLLP